MCRIIIIIIKIYDYYKELELNINTTINKEIELTDK